MYVPSKRFFLKLIIFYNVSNYDTTLQRPSFLNMIKIEYNFVSKISSKINCLAINSSEPVSKEKEKHFQVQGDRGNKSA